MVTSCQCFMMPSSHLVSVSLDQIHLCLHGLDPDNRHHHQYDVLGWCQDSCGKRTPKQQQIPGKSERKRQQQSLIRNIQQYASNVKDTARHVYVPFSHHPDPSSYIKEYTLYESYTSGYGVYPKGRVGQKQRILGPNKTSLDGRIQNEKTANTEAPQLGFGYYHGSTARKMPEQYFSQREQVACSKVHDTNLQIQERSSPKETNQPQQKKQQQLHQQEQHQQLQHQQQQQQQQQQHHKHGDNRKSHELLTVIQENSTSEDREANNRQKTKLALSMRGGLELGVRKRTPSMNFTLGEYYAKQIEREMIETIEEARSILRSSFRMDQTSENSTADLEPAVLKLDTINSVKYAVNDEAEDPEDGSMGSNMPDGTLVNGQHTSNSESESKDMLKLPELRKDCCCLKAKRNTKNENCQQTTKKKGAKSQPQNAGGGGRQVTLESSRVQKVRVQTRQNALEKNSSKSSTSTSSNNGNNNSEEVRHSMPSLASLYSTSDVAVRLVNPAKVVLPKLHKWLSDTALNDWNGNPVLPASKENTPMFSREFLEYANTLKNKDIFVMLHGLQRQKKWIRQSPREVLSVPNSGQDKTAVMMALPEVTGAAPPNTPEAESYHPEENSGGHRSKRRKSPNRMPSRDRHPESCISMAQIQNNIRPPRKKLFRHAECVYSKTEGMYGKTLNLTEPSQRKINSREQNHAAVVDQKHCRPKNQTFATRMTSRE